MTATALRLLPGQPSQPTAACELPASPAAAPAARRLVSRTLAACDLTDAQIADAVLIASELVTNALRHGTPPIRLRVRLQAGVGIVVAVSDAGTELPDCSPPSDGELAENGRGLLLVDALARSWTVDRDGEGLGKTVTAWLAV